MNWKNRLTNYNFWISIVSAVLLILQAFEFHFDIMYINEIATAVLGLLVVIGIINDPTKTSVKKENDANKTETKIEELHVQSNTEIIDKIDEIVEEKHEEFCDEKINNVTQEVEDKSLMEEETFPIDKQNEINNEFAENDIENFVNTITDEDNEQKLELKQILKNLVNLLKNNEKDEQFDENLENFSKKFEIYKKIEDFTTENIVNVVEENIQKESKKEVEEIENNIQIENSKTLIQTSDQPSSFNIVN